jgi:hypothetical protein
MDIVPYLSSNMRVNSYTNFVKKHFIRSCKQTQKNEKHHNQSIYQSKRTLNLFGVMSFEVIVICD